MPMMSAIVHPLSLIYLLNTSKRNFTCHSSKSTIMITSNTLCAPKNACRGQLRSLSTQSLVAPLWMVWLEEFLGSIDQYLASMCSLTIHLIPTKHLPIHHNLELWCHHNFQEQPKEVYSYTSNGSCQPLLYQLHKLLKLYECHSGVSLTFTY